MAGEHSVWPAGSSMAPCVTTLAPGWLSQLDVGALLPAAVGTSRAWDACTASRAGPCLMAQGSLPANLLLGHRAAFQCVISDTGYWFESLHLLPEVKHWGGEFKERRQSAGVLEQEKLEVGWMCCWDRKEEWDFAMRRKWCGGFATLQFSGSLPFVLTYSRAMLRHEDSTYPHTCDLQGLLLLLFEEWTWCFNVLFGNSSI